MRFLGICFLAVVVAACPARSRTEPPLTQDATARVDARPDPVAPPIPARPVQPEPHDAELPGDRHEIHPMGGRRYNVSREERRQARAAVILEALRKRLASLTPEAILGTLELAGPLEFWNPTSVRYYELRDATPIIAEELRRRGEAARPALLGCVGDRRQIFTGSAGPPLTLGRFCREQLEVLDRSR